MSMILDSEKLNPQYNQNSVLTRPWIAWGRGLGEGVPGPPSLATGLGFNIDNGPQILTLEVESFKCQYLSSVADVCPVASPGLDGEEKCCRLLSETPGCSA